MAFNRRVFLINFGGNKIAAHDGKVGCNTVEYTSAFIYSDWLYFLRHGMKRNIQCLHNSPTTKLSELRSVLDIELLTCQI